MKKILLLLSVILAGFTAASFRNEDIDQKLIDTFSKLYPHAEQVSWHETNNDYLVYFKDRGVRVRIVYAKDNSAVNITRYYEKEHLPYYILLILDKKFRDKEIFGITEISELGSTGNMQQLNYFITLHDDKKWYTVRIDDSGNATLIKKFNKAAVTSKTGTSLIYEDSVPFLIAFIF